MRFEFSCSFYDVVLFGNVGCAVGYLTFGWPLCCVWVWFLVFVVWLLVLFWLSNCVGVFMFLF